MGSAIERAAFSRGVRSRDAEIARLKAEVTRLTGDGYIPMLEAELTRLHRALAAGPAALRQQTYMKKLGDAAEIVEAAQEAAMKDDKKGGG